MAPISLEGQTLGKYRILEPLGRGGMAQVFRAYHAQLDRYVAVKVLRSDLVGEQEFLARFTREARSVAALRHPNIVQVFDFDVQNDYYYMVMELMEGDSLKAAMSAFRARGEMMPVKEIARILTDVLNGLGYAHAEGITHRDIKPANILLTRRGQAVVTDFGIAQIVGGTNYTVSGALMGTLHYMAPEQGMGTNVDGRSDLYSLGVVLYEILTGHPPFDADTPLAILMKHLNDPLPLPHAPDAVIPAPFERVVLKALAKKPEERYQTAAEMARAVQEAAVACEAAGCDQQMRVSNLVDETTASAVEPAVEPLSEPVVVPLEPPQVYSGDARQNMVDVNFAADETDMNLEQHLTDEVQAAASANAGDEAPTNLSASLDEVWKSAARLFTTVGGVVSVALTQAADEVKQLEPEVKEAIRGSQPVQKNKNLPAENEVNILGVVVSDDDLAAPKAGLVEVEEDSRDLHPMGAGQAAIMGASILVGANLMIVGIGVATGWWGFFEYGWAAELLLVSILLSLLMHALSNIWMIIPVGILLGNGLLFSFLSITGSWGLMGLFWPLEPLLVGGTIYLAITLSRNAPQHASRLARQLGRPLAILSGGAVALVFVGSFIATVVHGLFF